MVRKNGWNKNPREVSREKELSKPVAKSKIFASFLGSARKLRRHAHHSERALTRSRLNQMVKEAIDEIAFDRSDLEVLFGKAYAVMFSQQSVLSDWMPKRAKHCVAVHVTSDRVFFN